MFPLRSVSWYKDDVQLKDTIRRNGESTLLVSVETHGPGEYHCRALNHYEERKMVVVSKKVQIEEAGTSEV